jgi:hypothetical protein
MIEEVSVLNSTRNARERIHEKKTSVEKVSQRRNGFSQDLVTLIAEGGMDFFRYINKLGVSREPNLIVLSSKHHYYYDESDLKSVRVLVNLKKLNLIKHLDLFLNSLMRILPPDTTFIGYFAENKAERGNRFHFSSLLRVFSRFENFLDSRTDNDMDINEVSEILERNGFNVVNMTKMNGLTYFYSQYSRRSSNLN